MKKDNKNSQYLEAKAEIKNKNKDTKEFNKYEKDLKKNNRKDIKLINKANSTPKGDADFKNTPQNIIDLKGVNKYYTNKSTKFQALNNINLTIKRGDIVAILGTSGCGKTTLLNLIGGLDRATTGSIIVKDVNLSALKDKQLTLFRRYNLGFIFQSYNLLESLNVSDNIEIGRKLQKDNNKRKNIDSLLAEIDMRDRDKSTIYELSGGQQQRVSIARALAKSPEILICDEPTGALDSKTSLKVLNLFQNINKKNGTTIILVTHNEKIAEIANTIIKMKDGQIESVSYNKKFTQAIVVK
jgi:putative ABC transport system ATP-binding protein